MPKVITARAGDSLCNIAFRHGFGECTALRAEPKNAYIVNRAADPGQLRPGDKVTVPDIKLKNVDKPTDATHKFVKKGTLAMLRFIHGSASLPVKRDASLSFLNVSNYVTNRAGAPDGSAAFPNSSVRNFNADADKDIDAFKIEVTDIIASGDIEVELDVLKPIYDAAGKVTGHERFPAANRGDRELKATASKQGSLPRFRTCYLRLVTDAADKAAAGDQTLLVSDLYDAGDKKVEILDQMVRGSYEIKSCPENPKCRSIVTLPIGTDRRRLRVAVHVLRRSAGGAPIVSTADAERRILTWLRRSYAQMSISPKLVMPVREVDPPENLVSISNDTGLTARGNGSMGFRINSPGKPSQVIGPYTAGRGDKPIKTANALRALIKAPYRAVVSENPARFADPAGRRSADIVITEEGGGRVTIDRVSSNDSRQSLRVGRPNAQLFQEWDGNNWLVGSIEMRTVLKNYDTGDDRVDLFIIQRFISPTLLGAAMMSGHKVDPNRRAISKVKWSAFMDRRSSDGTDGFPFVIPHEAMHVVGEVMHAQGAANQIMNPTAQGANAVGSSKRVRDSAVTYDGGSIAGSHNLVRRMRVDGGSLMESW